MKRYNKTLDELKTLFFAVRYKSPENFEGYVTYCLQKNVSPDSCHPSGNDAPTARDPKDCPNPLTRQRYHISEDVIRRYREEYLQEQKFRSPKNSNLRSTAAEFSIEEAGKKEKAKIRNPFKSMPQIGGERTYEELQRQREALTANIN